MGPCSCCFYQGNRNCIKARKMFASRKTICNTPQPIETSLPCIPLSSVPLPSVNSCNFCGPHPFINPISIDSLESPVQCPVLPSELMTFISRI